MVNSRSLEPRMTYRRMTYQSFACATVIAAATAACGRPAPPRAGCEAAIARGMTLSADEERTLGTSATQRDAMRRIALARCKADRWPPVVLGCLATANAPGGYQACMGRVPQRDLDRLTKDMTAMMQAAPGGGSGALGGDSEAPRDRPAGAQR
jgi:hypothetical protein